MCSPSTGSLHLLFLPQNSFLNAQRLIPTLPYVSHSHSGFPVFLLLLLLASQRLMHLFSQLMCFRLIFQLVDFREVVSQMLGLNLSSLALPDYEIIKCLERLIQSHRHHFVTCACLKDATARQDRHPQGHLKLLH